MPRGLAHGLSNESSQLYLFQESHQNRSALVAQGSQTCFFRKNRWDLCVYYFIPGTVQVYQNQK